MHEIDIAQTDLNLLVVLDVLLQERNVTRAAQRLHRTQSAVSHALGRLRVQLSDPILVRVGGQMRPTPKAERLAPELSRLLGSIQRMLGDEDEFDAKTSERVFTVAAPDFFAAALPALVAAMTAEAPRANIELVAVGEGVFRDVAEGRFDLLLAPPRTGGTDGLKQKRVAELDWAVYARAGHPALRDWGLDAWRAYPHVRIRTGGGRRPVDEAVRRDGLLRRSGPLLPHFMLGPPLVAQTDLLMTVPRGVVATVADAFGLAVLPCPVKLAPVILCLFWSARRERDPGIEWFRAKVESTTQTVFRPPSHRKRAKPRRRPSRG